MLQFVIDKNDRYTAARQAELAIGAGCSWLVLAPSVNGEDAAEVARVCRDAGVILTMENSPELAQQLGAHGFVITDKSVSSVMLREKLGAEAIIGEIVGTAASAALLEKSDIDYGVIDPSMTDEQAAHLIAAARNSGCRLPLVLTGDFDAFDVPLVKAVGASGVATGRKLLAASDPAQAIGDMLAELKNVTDD